MKTENNTLQILESASQLPLSDQAAEHLYLVCRNTGYGKHTVNAVAGIFTTEEAAENACTTPLHFWIKLEVNKHYDERLKVIDPLYPEYAYPGQ